MDQLSEPKITKKVNKNPPFIQKKEHQRERFGVADVAEDKQGLVGPVGEVENVQNPVLPLAQVVDHVLGVVVLQIEVQALDAEGFELVEQLDVQAIDGVLHAVEVDVFRTLIKPTRMSSLVQM